MENKPFIETERAKHLRVTIQYVFRASFNDTYWLEELEIDLDKLKGDSLSWFDPYNGRSKRSDTQIALALCTDDKYVILEKRGDKLQKNERGIWDEHIICEDYDESMLIAAHIKIR